MDIRAVFFDLFGTLLIYGDMDAAWTAWLEALHHRLAAAGFTIDRKDLERRCGGLFSRSDPAAGTPGLTLYERRLEELCGELGAPAAAGHIHAMASETAAAWQRFVSIDPRTVPVLEELGAKLPVALISNYDHPPHVHELLAEEQMLELFHTVVVSGEVGVKKPDPAIFALALDRLGLEAAHVAYVGDAPEDVQGSVAAGMIPILIDRKSGGSWVDAADYGSTPEARRREHVARPAATVASLDEVVELVLR
jgi:HAD superfamily hydrolase (TIGR01549 family)